MPSRLDSWTMLTRILRGVIKIFPRREVSTEPRPPEVGPIIVDRRNDVKASPPKSEPPLAGSARAQYLEAIKQ